MIGVRMVLLVLPTAASLGLNEWVLGGNLLTRRRTNLLISTNTAGLIGRSVSDGKQNLVMLKAAV